MKKIQTLLMMFSLFFLFSFSSAATVTINITEFDGAEKVITEDNDEISSDVVYTLDLQSRIQNYPVGSVYFPTGYEYLIYYMDGKYYYFIYDSSYTGVIGTPHKTGNYDVTFVAAINDSNTCQKLIYGQVTPAGTVSSVLSDCQIYWKAYMPRLVVSTSDVYEFVSTQYSGNLNKVGYLGNVIEPSLGSSNKIVMENPLTDEEIKSILEIFLESVRNAGLPERYGRYVLTYNKITDTYHGYVYPSYIDLGLVYSNIDGSNNVIMSDEVGNLYSFYFYQRNNNYDFGFFETISSFFDTSLFKFESNSDNTAFKFVEELPLFKFSVRTMADFLSTVDEPIIYTSHFIYSLFCTDSVLSDGSIVVDHNTSFDNQIFIDDETGEVFDNTLNEFTNESITNVGFFEFFASILGFVLSLVSFVIRFFAFFVSLVVVPASTNILPTEFVTGIDWLHTFSFGNVMLWDIFSFLFLILLSIFIVKLIRSH